MLLATYPLKTDTTFAQYARSPHLQSQLIVDGFTAVPASLVDYIHL